MPHGGEAMGPDGIAPVSRDTDAVVGHNHGHFGVRHCDLNRYIAGMRVLDDIRERLLDQPEHHDGGVVCEQRLDLRIGFGAVQTGATAGLLGDPAHRRQESHIVEQCGPQAFDDSPFEVDAVVEHLQDTCPAALDVRIKCAGRTLVQPRDVHFHGNQQSPKFIVQLARQRCLFLFGQLLQVAREGRQLGGAPPHAPLELLVLVCELFGELGASARLAREQRG